MCRTRDCSKQFLIKSIASSESEKSPADAAIKEEYDDLPDPKTGTLSKFRAVQEIGSANEIVESVPKIMISFYANTVCSHLHPSNHNPRELTFCI